MDDEEDTEKRFSVLVCKGNRKNGHPCGSKVTNKEERCSKCNTLIPGRTNKCVTRNRPAQGNRYQVQYDEHIGFRTGNDCLIVFHVLAESSLRLSPGFRNIHLLFNDVDSNHDSTQLRMQYQRTSGMYDMYDCMVSLPREECLSATYNYYIEFDKTLVREIWKTTNYHTRFLDIQSYGGVQAMVNCYDGIVILVKKSVKMLKIDAEHSLLVYLQAIPKQHGEILATTIKEITTSLRKVYWEAFAKSVEIDGMYKRVVGTKFDWLWKELKDYDILDREARNNCFLAALTMIHLIYKSQMSDITQQQKISLCYSLLPECDVETKCCSGIDLLKKVFPVEDNNLRQVLLQFVNRLVQIPECLEWLFCMPLVHILQKVCKPWEPSSLDVTHTNGHWWGLRLSEDLELILETVKKKTKSLRFNKSEAEKKLKKIGYKLSPYFDMDVFLPRTLIASVSLGQLSTITKTVKIPPEVIFACLHYYVKTKPAEKLIKKEQSMRSSVYQATVYRQSDKWSPKEEGECRYRAMHIGFDMLNEIIRKERLPVLLVIQAARAVLFQVQSYHTITRASVQREKRNNLNDTLDQIYNLIAGWLQKTSSFKPGKALRDALTNWNRIFVFEPQIDDEVVRDSFNSRMQIELRQALNAWPHDVQLVKAYCKSEEDFCDEVSEVLAEFLFGALQDQRNQTITNIDVDEMKLDGMKNLGRILSVFFEKTLVRKGDIATKTGVLQLIEECSFFSLYWKFFHTPTLEGYISKPCKKDLQHIIDVIHCIVRNIMDGNIEVMFLLQIKQIEHLFNKMVKEIPSLKVQTIRNAIQLRHKELDAYKSCLSVLKEFVNLCHRFSGNLPDLADLIAKSENYKELQICQLCKPKHIQFLNKLENTEQYNPEVTAFNLPYGQLQAIFSVVKGCKGDIFLQLWDKRGLSVSNETEKITGIEKLLENVLHPTMRDWQDLHNELVSGTITFREFERLCGQAGDQDVKELLSPFEDGKDCNWIHERIRQMSRYRSLHTYLDAAKIIRDIVDMYSMDGDFETVKRILHLASAEDSQMKNLSPEHLTSCDILRVLDSKKVECLMKFRDSKPLVDWIRDKMNDLRELKVFIDLAYISTGDDPWEISKITCFQSAAVGYENLIFNQEQSCSLGSFLRKCEEVWKALNTNPRLPDQLEDTCRHLDWLKQIEEIRGSIEMTSLAQAKSINASGTYTIGNLGNTSKQLLLDDVMELKFSTTIGKSEKQQFYKYAQLLDLQSRLMLVVPNTDRNKDDVHRFLEVLDALKYLSNVYIKMTSSGCVLFSNFQVSFRCNKDSNVCIFITFGETKDKQCIRGVRDTIHADDSVIIRTVGKRLEKCYDEWLSYTNEQRDKNIVLNYFNMSQLVILQKELAKVGRNQTPCVLVYPLLFSLKQNCNEGDLKQALLSARQDLIDMEKQAERDSRGTSGDAQKAERGVEDVFIDMMKQANFSELLAKEALKTIPPNQIEDGITWCLANESEFVEPDLTENDFLGWCQVEDSLEIVTKKLFEANSGSANGLIEVIQNLVGVWENFLTSASSSFSDFLSLKHLALILKRLEETEDMTTFDVPGIEEGKPNLFVCLQDEMYKTVLAIYNAYYEDVLPSSDDVLLCSEKTTLDMLDIFWRRAFLSGDHKVHCLVNADLLRYEISDDGEKQMEVYMQRAQQKGFKYKLLVICSSENEFKCRLVAALDKYRRPNLSIGGYQSVKQYVQRVLTKDTQRINNPASGVDFDRSSVRVAKSYRAGVGKSFYARKMVNDLKERKQIPQNAPDDQHLLTLPIYGKMLLQDDIINVLLPNTLPPGVEDPRIIHIDISHEVERGVDAFLFQLLILGCLYHSSGQVWRRSNQDYYIIESMPILLKATKDQNGGLKCLHSCLGILPDVICRSPCESLSILSGNKHKDFRETDTIFDTKEFESERFQRPFQYLKRSEKPQQSFVVNPSKPIGERKECLETLLRHCGVPDPSWSELCYYVNFLNRQLQDFEKSSFCKLALRELPGFPDFVLKFVLQMSMDFSTRSLVCSESNESTSRRFVEGSDTKAQDIYEMYEMRRTWETSTHPYLFFNPDGHTMTFLGFTINPKTGDVLDQEKKKVLQKCIMTPRLFQCLTRQGVDLTRNFDQFSRQDKMLTLCTAMGIELGRDPDKTYELTTDNVKKMLAVYMRFKCEIPVLIMGETGCGKTRLIQFMCALQATEAERIGNTSFENIIIMKIHGGTTTRDIIDKVKQAEKIAEKNAKAFPTLFTVLFFDEANTTEAVGTIKEVMCDKTLGGQPIKLHQNLKIVAACNPYRKHKKEVINYLEQAGLGYYVNAERSEDKFGRVPMRRLVYRVQPLPPSMMPLVWDFGILNKDVEKIYIRQMVLRYLKEKKIPDLPKIEEVVSTLLNECQEYMREQKNECSFVSLRDVERSLEVATWFLGQTEENKLLYDQSAKCLGEKFTRSLVVSICICYQSSLKDKSAFQNAMTRFIQQPLISNDQMHHALSRCQDFLLDEKNIKLPENIARNQALKENVFLMIVCIELRIPLFLVGKPGSSKSLAKTIIADAMQGTSSRTKLFKQYKQVQIASFQCSPLSTPEGISGTFNQCAELQKDKDLDKFASVVVLDEVGLAEDSPRMPLKALHYLLENGCPGDETPLKERKVAFIGISNWALDPAKMNRGIFVQRNVPDVQELIVTARGICKTSDDRTYKEIENIIPALAIAYLDMFENAKICKEREFFGLRDFYSLIKQIYALTSQKKTRPSWQDLQHVILRNFGGLEEIDPTQIFQNHIKNVIDTDEETKSDELECSTVGMISACLSTAKNNNARYLLLLTENYGDLDVLRQKIKSIQNADIIFGSSFPCDQEYSQVCRNINRIKVCMESGKTVILLNLENLYESLYDALNQYYVYYGGERFVDLGLGSHRVKCKVHENFRLMVVAEKETVYNTFAIPLINRLEKHILSLRTILNKRQQAISVVLERWAEAFCSERSIKSHQICDQGQRKPSDVFMGYNTDTCAAVILMLCEKGTYGTTDEHEYEEVLQSAKETLLWCSTPDAVLRLGSTALAEDGNDLIEVYFKKQEHESLLQYLENHAHTKENMRVQMTTHSKLLSKSDMEQLCKSLRLEERNVQLLTLQTLDTEQQFCKKMRQSFSEPSGDFKFKLLIVQCSSGDTNADLIACARYSIQDEFLRSSGNNINTHVILIVQLPRVTCHNFSGFQCGIWQSIHLDDIHPLPDYMPPFVDMYMVSMSASMVSETDTENTLSGGKRSLDVAPLIFDCIQPALALVKDQTEDRPRKLERLDLLFSLKKNRTRKENENEDQKSFTRGVAAHLYYLLKEKENTNQQKEWLSLAAASLDRINRAGTFRRSVLQYIEEKLLVFLAGIIAFADKNRNLDILINEHDWKRKMWLQIWNSPTVTGLKYGDLLNQKGTTMLSEFVVEVTSHDGKFFTGRLPFSWIIQRFIDTLWTHILKRPDITEDSLPKLIEQAVDTLEVSPLGQILGGIKLQDEQMAIECYIDDFIHIVYSVKTEAELQVIHNTLMKQCNNSIEGNSRRFLFTLVACQANFYADETMYRHFEDITGVWPGCGEKVLEFNRKNQASDYEMILDLVGLHVLVENLHPPHTEAINSEEGKMEWMKKLCCYRPIAERIFVYFTQNGQQLSDKNLNILHQTRCAWTRAKVMKLYIDIVCVDDTLVKYCMSLWLMLGSEADLKTKSTLEKIERFLKARNTDVCKTLFSNDTCKHCKTKHQKRPTTLPCLDTICALCYAEALQNDFVKCPVCDKMFNINFTPPDSDKSENTYNEFVSKCNTFFMEVVSQLCFSGTKTPSDEVVIKLLSYITVQSKTGWIYSKNMVVFDDAIDRTPVVRSFLLQLLMRTRSSAVNKHLEIYFNKAVALVQKSEHNHDVTPETEVCLLVLRCMEDFQHQSFPGQNMYQNEEAHRIFNAAKGKIKMPSNKRLENLQHLANTRFAITVAAKLIYDIYVRKCTVIQPCHEQLFNVMGELFNSCGSVYPKLFFIKFFCRRFGVDCYHSLLSNCDVTLRSHITAPQLKKEMIECQDRFVVCGEVYQDFREMMAKVVVTQGINPLAKMLQTCKDPWKEVMFLLAVYRECTMKYKSEKQYLSQLTESAQHSLRNIQGLEQKKLMKDMIENTVWQHCRQNISSAMDLGSQGLSCLLTHFLILIKEIPKTESLMTPLQNIALNPEVMTNSYFPTMPQDELEEVRSVLMGSKRAERFRLMRCPNGHPYTIGDCGQPRQLTKCKICNREIGGMGVLVAGNTNDEGIDRTQPGHILGSVEDKSVSLHAQERNLSVTSCCMLRLITHIAMYVGTNSNLKAVSQSIHPEVKEENVPIFLLQHIEENLTTLSDKFGKSKEDILTLMHCLLQHIMDKQTRCLQKGVPVKGNMLVLKDKESREQWEKMFNEEFIRPVIKKRKKHLTTINTVIATDKRFGSDPLLKLLYDKEAQVDDAVALCDNPSIWRYRDIISIEHLMQKVENHGDQCPILDLFLQSENRLRALIFVPGIIRLQKMLIKLFAGKIERQDAATHSIGDVKIYINKDPRYADFDQCFRDFVEAWEIIRHYLVGYVFQINGNMVELKAEYCRKPIDESTKLSFILPSSGPSELCGIALLNYLLERQNKFLMDYLTKIKIATFGRLPQVLVKDVTSADLISYHRENDLLPLVFANCEYTFEVGKSTEIKYNFENIEKQLIDRFLFTKSIIRLESMETMTYKSEITNATVFMSVRTKVKQERISPAVLTQIREEIRENSFPAICGSMDKLDIAISFMKSIGVDENMLLSGFIVQTLKMDRTFASNKAQQTLQCKHIQSLWITLALERNLRLHKSGKEPFDNVTSTFKEPLKKCHQTLLCKSIKRLRKIQLDLFLELLLECIFLAIDIPQKDEEAYDPAKISLADALEAFLYDFPYEDPAPKYDWLKPIFNELNANSDDTLQGCHSVETWKFVLTRTLNG